MRRVAGPDAAFLYGERPEWHFHVSAVVIVDPEGNDRFSIDEIKRVLAGRLHLVPQFRWKLLEAPLRLDQPIWADDPDFDLDDHLHRVALPAPADDRALGELVGKLVSFKLDRHRPLWEMWLIEGLAGGRVAMLTKIHHAIIDGESGAELATLLFDLESDPEPGPEPPPWEPEPPPSDLERFASGALQAALWPLKVGRFAGQTLQQGVTMIRHARGDEPPAQPFQAPRTSLNGRLTPSRVFASAPVSLDRAKQVKNAFGVKLNDVILAISAGALRGYLVARDELPDDPLVAQIPVSIRSEDPDHVGTKVAAMFSSLATHVADPVARLRAIHTATQSAKEMREAMSAQRIINLTDTTPPALISLAARMWTLAGLDGRTPPVFNLIISNVPGPAFDLYMAGGRVDAMFPMGPLLYGSGVNFTIVSNATRLDFGLLACPDLVPDPWEIAAGIEPALDELVDAATASSPPS